MNERTNSHQDQTSDAQQKNSKNAEEGKMQTKQNKNENKFQVAYQEILKVKEGFEMKVTKPITNVTTRLSQGLGSKTPAKVLGGLAVGTLMLAATCTSHRNRSGQQWSGWRHSRRRVNVQLSLPPGLFPGQRR